MILCVLLLICSTSFVFAANNIVREYEFKAVDPDNLKYDVPEKVTEDGKTYKFQNVKYEIIEGQTIEVTERVRTNDKEDYAKSIEHKLPSGKTVTLYAEDGISWKEDEAEGIVRTQEYRSQNDIPQSIIDTKPEGNGNETEITLTLSGVESYSRTESFQAPATFYTPVRGGSMYQFNGKVVTINNGNPVWSGYQDDVKDYLGLNGNTYSITGGNWSDDYTLTGGQYVRHATYIGTRSVPRYRATFTETDATTTVYTADVTYSGIDPDKEVTAKAIVTYERGIGTREIIFIGAGIVIIALAVASILLFISRRKKKHV